MKNNQTDTVTAMGAVVDAALDLTDATPGSCRWEQRLEALTEAVDAYRAADKAETLAEREAERLEREAARQEQMEWERECARQEARGLTWVPGSGWVEPVARLAA